MEVSSQGLKYGRVAGVIFDVGCFLNIGEDHISPIEHTSAEDYFSSKLQIFSQCKKAVINSASDKAASIFEAAERALPEEGAIVSFSPLPSLAASLTAQEIVTIREPGFDGLSFKAVQRDALELKATAREGSAEGISETFVLGMTGTFNIENALAAISIARLLKTPEEHIKSGLLTARVPGRMEIFHLPNGAVILIDYAHNWMSFECLFASVESEYPGTRRTIVFGCPGYKALGRRFELGTLSGRFCAMTYLTEEDPGEEPVTQICGEIAGFVEAEGGAFQIIPDREVAICAALEDALADVSGNTVVLLTGKGRETRQKRGLDYVPVLSDVAIVEEFLSRL